MSNVLVVGLLLGFDVGVGLGAGVVVVLVLVLVVVIVLVVVDVVVDTWGASVVLFVTVNGLLVGA